MSQQLHKLTLTRLEVATLIKVIECQYDISNDTVTDDLYISAKPMSQLTEERLIEIRKSTSERIDILVVLTHTLATLQTLGVTSGGRLIFTDNDLKILHNEITCHLCMLNDMLGDDDTTSIQDKVQHIVNINLILQPFNK